ncbi:hypothetical protein F4604DRAFT_1919629 [Suillus subluteus]|nr:hypothetical protein F4604DRAFT_1919629 [Suillus subluteus]
MSNTTTPSKAFKVSKPADFDGLKDAFAAWFRHVLMYFESQDTVIPTSKQKIIFTMSYMKTGFTGEWAALAYDREKAKSSSSHAQERLSTFTQGKMPIEEFLTHWMQILVTAEYTNIKPNSTTANHLINILHTNVHLDIIDSVDEEPDMYGCHDLKKWTHRILVKGWILERRHSRQGVGTNQRVPNPNYRPPPNRTSAPQPNPSSLSTGDHTDSSGVTCGGRGQPMDLSRQRARENNLCYHCGQAGHIARNCKNHAQAIRQMLDGLNGSAPLPTVSSYSSSASCTPLYTDNSTNRFSVLNVDEMNEAHDELQVGSGVHNLKLSSKGKGSQHPKIQVTLQKQKVNKPPAPEVMDIPRRMEVVDLRVKILQVTQGDPMQLKYLQ